MKKPPLPNPATKESALRIAQEFARIKRMSTQPRFVEIKPEESRKDNSEYRTGVMHGAVAVGIMWFVTIGLLYFSMQGLPNIP